MIGTEDALEKIAVLLAKERQALAEHPEEQATIRQSIASLEKMQRQLEAAESAGKESDPCP